MGDMARVLAHQPGTYVIRCHRIRSSDDQSHQAWNATHGAGPLVRDQSVYQTEVRRPDANHIADHLGQVRVIDDLELLGQCTKLILHDTRDDLHGVCLELGKGNDIVRFHEGPGHLHFLQEEPVELGP